MLQGVLTAGVKREGPAKRLSDVEFKLWKETGFNFRCDKQYTVGHQCKIKG